MAKAPKKTSKLGDNSEAREAALLVNMARLRAVNAEVDMAKAVVDGAKENRKVVRGEILADGFKLKVLDEAIAKEKQSRVDQQAEENERRFVFTSLGLPIAQDGVDLETAAQRDEKFWGDHGYATGVKGLAAEKPPGIPPEFLQVWLKRHAAGADRLAWAQAEQQGIVAERAPDAEVRDLTPVDEEHEDA